MPPGLSNDVALDTVIIPAQEAFHADTRINLIPPNRCIEAYAVAHPDSVVGVVLLDSFTGVDYDIDQQQNFQGACLEANRQADAFDSLERLDNCRLAEWVHDRRDREPAVPLLYLAAQDASDRGLEADDATRKAWVESWSPGTWQVVNAPHWMEKADPELVANAVREVIGLIN